MNAARVLIVLSITFIGLCVNAGLTPRQPSAQDTPAISENCADCHEGKLETLSGSVHEIRIGDPNSTVSCNGCHIGDPERHMDDPDEYKLTNPADTSVQVMAGICAKCHSTSHQQNMQEFNVHAENDINCSGCHAVHSNVHPTLLKEREPELCYTCHLKTEGDFARAFRHPVADGIITCSECHLTLDETHRELSFRGIAEVCWKCHNQFQGPFPYDHLATVYFSTQEGGCLNCHEPHGSNLPRMTKQPYDAPNFALCSQCHSVPKHDNNDRHGSSFAGVPCNDCHVDIHGSYDNRYFLSPALRGQGCDRCHSF
ncbi:MAG: hypothetical protein JSW50_05190 [Candidatus Latescibacterota bacterium]|nr:MAG: hypothetical protein JSW50_05190 [Candidatus Latescibacterota bacterium]